MTWARRYGAFPSGCRCAARRHAEMRPRGMERSGQTRVSLCLRLGRAPWRKSARENGQGCWPCCKRDTIGPASRRCSEPKQASSTRPEGVRHDGCIRRHRGGDVPKGGSRRRFAGAAVGSSWWIALRLGMLMTKPEPLNRRGRGCCRSQLAMHLVAEGDLLA